MGRLQRFSVQVLADASGDATVYTESVNGLLHSVWLDQGTLATGTDLVITEAESARPLLTITNTGVADLFWYPRVGIHPVANTAGGTIVPGGTTTGGDGVARTMIPVVGRIKVALGAGSGGNAGAGTLHFDIVTSLPSEMVR